MDQSASEANYESSEASEQRLRQRLRAATSAAEAAREAAHEAQRCAAAALQALAAAELEEEQAAAALTDFRRRAKAVTAPTVGPQAALHEAPAPAPVASAASPSEAPSAPNAAAERRPEAQPGADLEGQESAGAASGDTEMDEADDIGKPRRAEAAEGVDEQAEARGGGLVAPNYYAEFNRVYKENQAQIDANNQRICDMQPAFARTNQALAALGNGTGTGGGPGASGASGAGGGGGGGWLEGKQAVAVDGGGEGGGAEAWEVLDAAATCPPQGPLGPSPSALHEAVLAAVTKHLGAQTSSAAAGPGSAAAAAANPTSAAPPAVVPAVASIPLPGDMCYDCRKLGFHAWPCPLGPKLWTCGTQAGHLSYNCPDLAAVFNPQLVPVPEPVRAEVAEGAEVVERQQEAGAGKGDKGAASGVGQQSSLGRP